VSISESFIDGLRGIATVLQGVLIALCRLHGGKSTGPPKGNKNALKHGRYTAQAIARRRELRALLRSIKQFTDETF
jgi:hypothetical protein